MEPTVVAVHRSPEYTFSKRPVDEIVLVEGFGIEGDVHAGETIRHRSRVANDPTQPNLRQVHLIHAELFDQVAEAGFAVAPGEIGENITTRGIDLLGLPTRTLLRLGGDAVVEITGLRNPCVQIDRFQPGLQSEMLDRDAAGEVVRKAGIMGIVVSGGTVRPGEGIEITLPPEPHQSLEKV
ncbi:MAG TPA: MOSC domain-containing protein [Acidimicrobiales bacterium]|nr:MOSC domain-containing protein [Acidimicrobiales bacterium]